MAVDNRVFLKFVSFSVCMIISSGCVSREEVNSKRILEHMSRNVLEASHNYSLQIEYCDNIISTSQAPKLDKKLLNNLAVTREDAVIAITFLQFRNYFLCEQEARLKLAFHLGAMESIRTELGFEVDSIEDIQLTVSYPSRKELELEVKYFAFSKKVRNYFESVVGSKPFDLMATLEANELLNQQL